MDNEPHDPPDSAPIVRKLINEDVLNDLANPKPRALFTRSF